MKKLLLAVALVLTAINAQAAKSIIVEFSYEAPADSFTVYMDETPVCTATNDSSPSIVCEDLNMNYGVHLFTMTATYQGQESLHSPAYTFAYKPELPTPPATLEIKIIINGVETVLKPTGN